MKSSLSHGHEVAVKSSLSHAVWVSPPCYEGLYVCNSVAASMRSTTWDSVLGTLLEAVILCVCAIMQLHPLGGERKGEEEEEEGKDDMRA